MTGNAWLQIGLYLTRLLLLVKPLGSYMARVYEGESPLLGRVLGPLERLFYRVSGVEREAEMTWRQYALAVLVFNVAGLFVVYALQRLQGVLPLNPQALPAVSPDSSFNTAASFATNTNWQGLLPLSLVVAVILVSQGVVQTFSAYPTASLLDPFQSAEGGEIARQSIAVGPAASQIAIKQLGTNGGGFFNVNSAHPFEDPTPISNFVELLSILLIPAASCYTFGKMVKDTRPRLGAARRDARRVPPPARALRLGRAVRKPRAPRARRRSDCRRAPVRREHGGQGGAPRHHELRALGHGHHRGLLNLALDEID